MSKPILKKRQRTTLAALLLCTAAATHAATQSPALAFDLPAQPLDAALRAYAGKPAWRSRSMLARPRVNRRRRCAPR